MKTTDSLRVLLNCSTLVKGGALQVAVAVLTEVSRDSDARTWRILVSPEVLAGLQAGKEKSGTLDLVVVPASPAHSREARARVRGVERAWEPEVVFTLFGPAYVRFAAPHLCGVADGWVTHAGRLAFRLLPSWWRRLSVLWRVLYKAYWYRWADAWLVEAEVARQGLGRRWRFPTDRVHVVSNSCGDKYFSESFSARMPQVGERVRILCLSAYYPHKNLELLPAVARELRARKRGLDFEFVLTLPNKSREWGSIQEEAARLGVAECLTNAGPVAVEDGPELYRSCHMCILPSVLETFSANYPEAMATRRPMVTTDLAFARDICGKAAMYFRAMDAGAAAEVIVRLTEDRELWMRTVLAGEERLRMLPKPGDRLALYRRALAELVRGARRGRAGM